MKQRKLTLILILIAIFALVLVGIVAIIYIYTLENPEVLESIPKISAPSSIPPQPDRYPEAYIFPGEPVQLVWFYKPPQNGDLETVAAQFDTFILTKKDEEERDKLKELGVTAPILEYLRFDAIMDPGDCESTPWGNQVAYEAGDFCRISQEHPGWFLLDRNGNRIEDSERFFYMDPGNPEWRAFWLQRARRAQEELGWEGVFLDNVEASLQKHENVGLEKYPSHAGFQEATVGFLDYIYSEYFQPQGRPLYANIISLDNTEVWFRYLNYLDGAMVEAWVVDWHDHYRWPDRWEEHLQLAEQTQEMGKEIILIAQGDRDDTDRQRFAFASYLLITEGRASFRYSLANHHQVIRSYPNYAFDLGLPLGARYQDGDFWVRDFQRGQVQVNPKTHQASIVVGSEK